MQANLGLMCNLRILYCEEGVLWETSLASCPIQGPLFQLLRCNPSRSVSAVNFIRILFWWFQELKHAKQGIYCLATSLPRPFSCFTGFKERDLPSFLMDPSPKQVIWACVSFLHSVPHSVLFLISSSTVLSLPSSDSENKHLLEIS